MKAANKTQTKTKTIVGIGLLVSTIGVLGFAAGIYYYGKKIVCPKCPVCQTAKNSSSSTSSSSSTNNPSNTNTNNNSSAGNQSQAKKNVDLAITYVLMSSSCSVMDTGFYMAWGVTIVNNGTDSSGPFKIKVEVPDNHNTQIVEVPDGVGPGQEKTIRVSQKNSTIGCKNLGIHMDHTIIITLDPDNQVKETNENNNIKEVEMMVL